MGGTAFRFFCPLTEERRRKNPHPKPGGFSGVKKIYFFEIGGRSRGKGRIKDRENAFVARDDIEVGFGNVIPLWLFGFLY